MDSDCADKIDIARVGIPEDNAINAFRFILRNTVSCGHNASGIDKNASAEQCVAAILSHSYDPHNPRMFGRLRNDIVTIVLILIEFPTFLAYGGGLDC